MDKVTFYKEGLTLAYYKKYKILILTNKDTFITDQGQSTLQENSKPLLLSLFPDLGTT